MGAREPTSALDPAALAAVGKLRECVAAARNLEHLVSSRDVGPKVLEQIVPEVAGDLLPFQAAIAEAAGFVTRQLRLDQGSLDALVLEAERSARDLSAGLVTDQGAPMNAKRRLSIERAIRESLPSLVSALGQMELLVEATSAEGVTMSVHELLSSTPEAGSSRPHRRVAVTGPIESLVVETPVRIGLRCLGMVASTKDPLGKASLSLRVDHTDAEATFEFREGAGDPGATLVKLPIYAATSHGLTVADAALRRYAGSVDTESLILRLSLVR